MAPFVLTEIRLVIAIPTAGSAGGWLCLLLAGYGCGAVVAAHAWFSGSHHRRKMDVESSNRITNCEAAARAAHLTPV